MRHKLKLESFGENALAKIRFFWQWRREREGALDILRYLVEHPDTLYWGIDSLTKFRELPDSKTAPFICDYNAMAEPHAVRQRAGRRSVRSQPFRWTGARPPDSGWFWRVSWRHFPDPSTRARVPSLVYAHCLQPAINAGLTVSALVDHSTRHATRSFMEVAMKKILLVSCALGLLTAATIASASPACGVAPDLLTRGTYDPFRVRTDHDSPIDFQARAKSEVDIVVRKHEYLAGGYTGWHRHPGPVFITVEEGEITFYEADDPSCTGKLVKAGEGYVDDGRGHYGVASNGPAVDISVILAPVGLPFREEISPSPYCSLPPPCPL